MLLTFNITIRDGFIAFIVFLIAFTVFFTVVFAFRASAASILACALASRATWRSNSLFSAFAAFSAASLAFFSSLSSISLVFLTALSIFSYSSYIAFLAWNSRVFFTSSRLKNWETFNISSLKRLSLLGFFLFFFSKIKACLKHSALYIIISRSITSYIFALKSFY